VSTVSDRFEADPARYDGRMSYRRAGASGLDLPALSLGLWQNFGDTNGMGTQARILRRALDLGITHLDLANNYGPPYGAAERNFGEHLRRDLAPYRDELVISSKAGYDMWPGPYGDGGSRKYLFASLDQTLKRTGLDYVDIYYHHRPDPTVPVEETMGALQDAVRAGKALYVGISNYSAAATQVAAEKLAAVGGRLLVHQPRYSMLDRNIERLDGEVGSILDVVDRLGIGVVVFSPLAQGILTDRYLRGVPEGSRATHSRYFSQGDITGRRLELVSALNELAKARGQNLAQLALSWVLRDGRVTSAIIGASSVEQLNNNVQALTAPPLTSDELSSIESLLESHTTASSTN
jgi:L-glyceraldehyde 3-phosphate reductase